MNFECCKKILFLRGWIICISNVDVLILVLAWMSSSI